MYVAESQTSGREERKAARRQNHFHFSIAQKE
jgi:hypothetical protein